VHSILTAYLINPSTGRPWPIPPLLDAMVIKISANGVMIKGRQEVRNNTKATPRYKSQTWWCLVVAEPIDDVTLDEEDPENPVYRPNPVTGFRTG
jgi:hypothetical protein